MPQADQTVPAQLHVRVTLEEQEPLQSQQAGLGQLQEYGFAASPLQYLMQGVDAAPPPQS